MSIRSYYLFVHNFITTSRSVRRLLLFGLVCRCEPDGYCYEKSDALKFPITLLRIELVT